MLPAPVRGARAAFVFLSRIPLGGFPYQPADWRWAPAHFPLVGLVVGLVAGAVVVLARPGGELLAAALAIVVSIWVTGAFHEDGLADSADALGGAHGPKALHEILKDSRIGTYGACALVSTILLRTLALAELIARPGEAGLLGVRAPWWEPMLLLALVHGLARVGPVGLMAWLPYVGGDAAKGAAVARGGALPQALVAALWGLGASGLAWAAGVSAPVLGVLWGIVVGVSALLGCWFRVRAGGIVGDFLGATEQVLEMALLLGWLGWLGWFGGFGGVPVLSLLGAV